MLAISILAVIAIPVGYGQAPPPYWSPGSGTARGTAPGTVPSNPYGTTGAANPYAGTATGMNPYISGSAPGGTAGASMRGPIVAQPFRAEPPKPLIGERTREEQADPLRVTIEEFTDAKIGDLDTIPVVNTIEEYQAVREAKEPAILFDGNVYIYVKEEDAYKPLNWDVEQTNTELWDQIQYDRVLRIQQYQAQRYQAMAARYGPRTLIGGPAAMRAGAYGTPGGGAGMGYSRQPGVGAPAVPSGAMPVRRR